MDLKKFKSLHMGVFTVYIVYYKTQEQNSGDEYYRSSVQEKEAHESSLRLFILCLLEILFISDFRCYPSAI